MCCHGRLGSHCPRCCERWSPLVAHGQQDPRCAKRLANGVLLGSVVLGLFELGVLGVVGVGLHGLRGFCELLTLFPAGVVELAGVVRLGRVVLGVLGLRGEEWRSWNGPRCTCLLWGESPYDSRGTGWRWNRSRHRQYLLIVVRSGGDTDVGGAKELVVVGFLPFVLPLMVIGAGVHGHCPDTVGVREG